MATGYHCQQVNSRRLLSDYVTTKGTHKLIEVASMYTSL